MRHLAAYILLVCGGNASPSAADVTNVLSQAGVEVDTERLEKLIAELAGKDINELVELGKEKLMPVGSGGGGGGGAAAAPAAGGKCITCFPLVTSLSFPSLSICVVVSTFD